MTYAAPLDEMRFVLNHLAGLPEIAALPGCEDAEPELVEAILIEASRFASEVLAPLNATGDRQGCRWSDGEVATPDGFPAAYRQFLEAGWHSMPASPEIGGQGMPALVSSAVAEMWKSANLAFSLVPDADHGRRRGDRASCVRRTQAALLAQDGRWRVDRDHEPDRTAGRLGSRRRCAPGPSRTATTIACSDQKIFITWGEHDVTDNIVHLVLARLPDAPPGTRGISLFLAPKFLVNAGRQRSARATTSLRLHRAQARHPRLAHLRDVVWRQGRRGRLPGRRAEPRPRVHVHDDERCPAECRARGRGHRRARLSAGRRVCPRARAGPASAARERARSSSTRTCGGCCWTMRAQHRGDARAGLLHRRLHGPRPAPPDADGARAQPGRGSTC